MKKLILPLLLLTALAIPSSASVTPFTPPTSQTPPTVSLGSFFGKMMGKTKPAPPVSRLIAGAINIALVYFLLWYTQDSIRDFIDESDYLDFLDFLGDALYYLIPGLIGIIVGAVITLAGGLGERLVGIKVIDKKTGEDPTLVQNLAGALPYFHPLCMAISYIFVFFNEDRQALHDMLAGTQAVEINK